MTTTAPVTMWERLSRAKEIWAFATAIVGVLIVATAAWVNLSNSTRENTAANVQAVTLNKENAAVNREMRDSISSMSRTLTSQAEVNARFSAAIQRTDSMTRISEAEFRVFELERVANQLNLALTMKRLDDLEHKGGK